MKNRISKKLFMILLGYMAAYHMIYISKRIFLKFMGEPGYLERDWGNIIFAPIFCNFIIMPPIIILIIFATKRMIEKNLGWFSSLSLHFFFSLLYFFLVVFLNTIYNYYVYGDALELFNRTALLNIVYGSTLNFLGYIGFITIIYSYYYVKRIRKSEKQKVKLTRQLQNVKMQALKSQLNPHFLFNTLNSISSLIKEDAHKAQHLIGNLGDLLREVLLQKDENLIPLNKEMSVLQKYLDIMQTRFSDHLSLVINVDDTTKDALIPSMLLQPILENSFKHGYGYGATNLEIVVSVIREGDNLLLSVKNDGMPLEDKKEGLGLKNIYERLQTLYGKNFRFIFKNRNREKGVITEIKIPFKLVTATI